MLRFLYHFKPTLSNTVYFLLSAYNFIKIKIMPNWCFTDYVIPGDENEISDLYFTNFLLTPKRRTCIKVTSGSSGSEMCRKCD